MSDPSSLFLAAAFATGIIEGASVQHHYRNASENNKSPSAVVIAAYSTLYGAVSLPLGLIGASPGAAFHPKTLELSIVSQDTVDKVNRDKHGVFDTSSESVARENGVSREMQIHSFSSSVTGNGRGIGRRLREENLKKMHSSHNNYVIDGGRAISAPPPSETLNSFDRSRLSRYITTLDGRALPTQLSEAMRRSRCIFVGAALVSLCLTKYTTHNASTDLSNVTISDLPLVDEFGRIDYNHGIQLQKRLLNDAKKAAVHTTAIYSYVNSVCNIDSFANKLREFAQSALYNAIEKVQQQPEINNLSNTSSLTWLMKYKDEISRNIKDENNQRPIALRLVLNENNNMPRREYLRMSAFVQRATKIAHIHDPFFVLPIHFDDNEISGKSPWWQIDSDRKQMKDLPVISTWLINNLQQNSSLIIESNTCPSIHEMLKRRYSNKRTSFNISNGDTSLIVSAFSRMLLTSVKPLVNKQSAIITNLSIVFREKGKKTSSRDTAASKWSQSISIDGLDVLKWAIVSIIISETKSTLKTNSDEPRKDHSIHAKQRATKYASGKDVATPWTIVDVIGVSVRHLLESTLDVVSAAASFLARPTAQLCNQQRNELIRIISPNESTSAWLRQSFQAQGWAVETFYPNEEIKRSNGKLSEVYFVLGASDLETCQIACLILQQQQDLLKNTQAKLVLLLEDPSKYDAQRVLR